MEIVNSTGGAYRTNEIARLLVWATEGVETGGFIVEVLLLPDDLGTLRDDFYGVARPDDASLKRLGLARAWRPREDFAIVGIPKAFGMWPMPHAQNWIEHIIEVGAHEIAGHLVQYRDEREIRLAKGTAHHGRPVRSVEEMEVEFRAEELAEIDREVEARLLREEAEYEAEALAIGLERLRVWRDDLTISDHDRIRFGHLEAGRARWGFG